MSIKCNIRFASYESRCPLFELEVGPSTTVSALKAMAEDRLTIGDIHCPMLYFDKWYCEGQIGSSKKLVSIDVGDNDLVIAAAGMVDESIVYLDGPTFEEGQSQIDVGRAIAVVRAQARADMIRQAKQHHELMKAMELMELRLMARIDEGACILLKTCSSTSNCVVERHISVTSKLDLVSANLDILMTRQTAQLAEVKKQSEAIARIEEWRAEDTDEEEEEIPYVDAMLGGSDNKPMRAFWVALHEKSDPENPDGPMSIIMDERCGLERRAGVVDGPMTLHNKRFTINNKESRGATPLIMAVHAGRNDVVSALLDIGANFKATFGQDKITAVHVAAIVGNIAALNLMVCKGASVNCDKKTYGVITPLHYAAQNGDEPMIRELVRLGATKTTVDPNGQSSYSVFADRRFRHLSEDDKRSIKTLLCPTIFN